jgi:hypothetical protein
MMPLRSLLLWAFIRVHSSWHDCIWYPLVHKDDYDGDELSSTVGQILFTENRVDEKLSSFVESWGPENYLENTTPSL